LETHNLDSVTVIREMPPDQAGKPVWGKKRHDKVAGPRVAAVRPLVHRMPLGGRRARLRLANAGVAEDHDAVVLGQGFDPRSA
jgi:hypothetical protein